MAEPDLMLTSTPQTTVPVPQAWLGLLLPFRGETWYQGHDPQENTDWHRSLSDWLLLLLGPSTLPGPNSSLSPKGNRDDVYPLVFRAAHTLCRLQLSLNLVLLPPQPVVFLGNNPLGF